MFTEYINIILKQERETMGYKTKFFTEYLDKPLASYETILQVSLYFMFNRNLNMIIF